MEPRIVKELLAKSWQCCLHDESHFNCSGIKHRLETVSSNHLCICMSPPVTQAVGRTGWGKTSFVSLSVLNAEWSLLCLSARYQREMLFVFGRAAFKWWAGAELLLVVLYKDSFAHPAPPRRCRLAQCAARKMAIKHLWNTELCLLSHLYMEKKKQIRGRLLGSY